MIEYRKYITRAMLRAEPDKRFVFGDNMARRGWGGQAKEMRGEPNAIGVATKVSPSEYMTGTTRQLKTLVGDLERVAYAAFAGHTIVWPENGIGTGFANLKEHWPEGLALIEAFRACLENTK